MAHLRSPKLAMATSVMMIMLEGMARRHLAHGTRCSLRLTSERTAQHRDKQLCEAKAACADAAAMLVAGGTEEGACRAYDEVAGVVMPSTTGWCTRSMTETNLRVPVP